MRKTATGLILCLGIVFGPGPAVAADIWGDEEIRAAEETQQDIPDAAATASRSAFALGVKMGWHWFFEQGVLTYSSNPYYGVSAGDLQGLNGELDFDYFFREWLVFTATAGGYGANLSRYSQDYITGYGLLSAKLQRPGNWADYYVGAGVGGYLSRVSNEVDTAYALQPGLHVLLGIRFHLTREWSLLLEDRAAFTLMAQGLFKSLNLGGNHLFLGTSYRF